MHHLPEKSYRGTIYRALPRFSEGGLALLPACYSDSLPPHMQAVSQESNMSAVQQIPDESG